MSTENLISLIVFLWVLAIYGILRFLRAAHPYREDSEEQRMEDREQERALKAIARSRKRKRGK